MEDFKSRYSTAIGPSMYPTLKPGDGIELVAYRDTAEIRVGDIIIYPHPERPTDVVHRIIALKAQGVITRGDNNDRIDPYTVLYGDIVGKVVAAKRKDRLVRIRGGKTGFMIHRLMLFRKSFLLCALAPLRVLSHILARSKLLNIFHSFLKIKVIRITRSDHSKSILMVGKKAVGSQMAGSGEWQIRFPYKFFINRERLPQISGHGGNK